MATFGTPSESVLARRGARAEPELGLSRCWFTEESDIEGLRFGLAEATDDFEKAFALVHDQYVACGYMFPQPRGWRLSLFNALPSTKVFVAREGSRVIGTLTLVLDSRLGLPMEEIYGGETDDLRKRGRNLAEVSGLAIDHGWRSMGVAIMLRLVRMMVLYAAEVAGLDDLLIAVNPSHAVFYRRGLHFELLGGLREYQKVNGAPAIALRFDLGLARRWIRDQRQGRPMPREIHRFLFGPEACAGVIPGLLAALPRSSLSPQQFEHFFGDRDLLRLSAPEEWRFVEAFYEDDGVGRPARTLVYPWRVPDAQIAS